MILAVAFETSSWGSRHWGAKISHPNYVLTEFPIQRNFGDKKDYSFRPLHFGTICYAPIDHQYSSRWFSLPWSQKLDFLDALAARLRHMSWSQTMQWTRVKLQVTRWRPNEGWSWWVHPVIQLSEPAATLPGALEIRWMVLPTCLCPGWNSRVSLLVQWYNLGVILIV